MTVSPTTDDHGNNRQGATALDLSSGGTDLEGMIEVPGDTDWFRVVPGTSGNLLVQLVSPLASSLSEQLSIVDSFGTPLANGTSGYDSDIGTFGLVYLPVVAGQTYYITAAADPSAVSDFQTGDYDLKTTLVPTLRLGPSGTAVQSGVVATSGAERLYEFVATSDGGLVVEQDAVRGSSLNSYLEVLDSQGEVIAANDDCNDTHDSRVAFNVIAGEHYFIGAGASPDAPTGQDTGGFQLRLRLGPVVLGQGNSAGDASVLQLSGGVGGASGALDLPGDRATFTMRSDVSGMLTVSSGNSAIDAVVYVFDSGSRLVASNVDDPRHREATFTATANQTYYVRVAAAPTAPAGRDTGDFTLSVNPDDAGSTPSRAEPIQGRQQGGAINGPGDVDSYRIVAPSTGVMTVNLGLQSGRVVGTLEAFGKGGQSLGSGSGEIQLEVTAGETYYLLVGASNLRGDVKYLLEVDTVGQEEGGGGGGVPEPGPGPGHGDIIPEPHTQERGETSTAALRQVAELLPVDGVALALVATLLVGSEEARGTGPAEGAGPLLAAGINALPRVSAVGGDAEVVGRPEDEGGVRDRLGPTLEMMRQALPEVVAPFLDIAVEALARWLEQKGNENPGPGRQFLPDPAEQLTPPAEEEMGPAAALNQESRERLRPEQALAAPPREEAVGATDLLMAAGLLAGLAVSQPVEGRRRVRRLAWKTKGRQTRASGAT